MNKVFLIGRLTKDPELSYTASNVAVARFTVAVNRTFTNQAGEREADFINVTVWRKIAENIKNYLSKGSQVAIDGRIQTSNYDDEKGNKIFKTDVIADNVQFLDTKASRENNNVTNYDVKKVIAEEDKNKESNPFADFGTSIQIDEDELPF